MSEKLIKALEQLDTTNDEHWTQDGLPRLDVLKSLAGETVTRADIFACAKSFNRYNTDLTPVDEEVDEDTVEGDGSGEQLPEAGNTAKEVESNVVTDKEEVAGLKQFESDELEAEHNLKEARIALYEAQNAFNVAQEVADGFRAAKAKREDAVPAHLAIKAFQQSQAEQRAKDAESIALLKKFASGASEEQKALLKDALK